MKRASAAIALLLSVIGQTSAQENDPWELEEVVVSDIRLERYTEGHKLTVLPDSVLKRHGIFLTQLLSYESNIHFRENGFGMVSSPSFRGTNASHTAVIWNGININSPLNGQVDFNTINPLAFNSVTVRSGGGSVQYGTGAIGGSVHLNDRLSFDEHFEHRTILGYGSFNTSNLNYGQRFGNGQWSHNFGIAYNASDNDYKYLDVERPSNGGEGQGPPEEDRRNQNGEFGNLTLNFNSGYRLSEKKVLRLYHQSFIGDRNLSGNLVAVGRSRYEDAHYRTQLEYVQTGGKTTSTLKLAHLYEGFRYFENKDFDIFSDGRVTTLLARYSYDRELTDALRLNGYAEYNHFRGSGGSFGNPTRNDVGLTALLKHKVLDGLAYNVGLRKDFSSDFTSPYVFSFGSDYKLSPAYSLQLNASRNFRMPTFNDLYWSPGGNLDLVPESSYQIDLGQQWQADHLTLNLNGFHIATRNMIRWLPQASGIWSPINVDEVRTYGVEGEVAWDYPILQKQNLQIKGKYAYTVSEDMATGEQLIYVPFHRANMSIAYSVQRFDLFYRHLYTGRVSTLGGELDGYQVGNVGIRYAPKLNGKLQYSIGLNLNNVFNAYYENVALRPMPNRNIQTQVFINF